MALATDYLDQADITTAHNAANDVVMLQKLLTKLYPDIALIIAHTRSVSFLMDTKKRNDTIKIYKKSLDDLTISASMKSKISKTGIDKSLWKNACDNGGIDGLTILLGENVDGKPRVTKNKKLIQKSSVELRK